MSYENLFDLSGRVALITGAAGGLGREIARGLVEYGAHIAFADLFPEKPGKRWRPLPPWGERPARIRRSP